MEFEAVEWIVEIQYTPDDPLRDFSTAARQEGTIRVSEVLRSWCHLLDLTDCLLDDAAFAQLLDALQRDCLEHLDLCRVNVNYHRAADLAGALHNRQALRHLNLDGALLASDGTRLLAAGLPTMTALRFWGLQRNGVRDAGAEPMVMRAFWSAIASNTDSRPRASQSQHRIAHNSFGGAYDEPQ